MSRRCDICGKGTLTGNTVSKSRNHQRRTWKPNIVRIKTEIDGTTGTIRVCTRCLKSGFVTKKV
ncbi:MAG: 50S ribosomal protein L28 [Treponemataceae bacterium]|nr:50S ribosomal protein L28 [Treponemataceae bacterium]